MGIKRRIFTTALTLAAGAIAGVLLAPRSGKETKKHLKALSEKIKREVSAELVRVEVLSRKTYNDVVSATLEYYRRIKKVKQADLDVIARDLHARWKDVLAEIKRSERREGTTSRTKKSVKRPLKKGR